MRYTLALSAAGLLAVAMAPAASLAATNQYIYINLHGTAEAVDAPSATAALAVASKDSLHSGVQIDPPQPNPYALAAGEQFGQTYRYVTLTGELSDVTASSADAAFILATNRAPHSGVQVMP